MTEEMNEISAKRVYDTLCTALDEIELKYDKKEDDLAIYFIMQGEDIPMDFIIQVHQKPAIVHLISPLPFKIEEEKIPQIAMAVCAANNALLNGAFDLDMQMKRISFRMSLSYYDSLLGKENLKKMVGASVGMTDDFNDMFLMLNKGMISLDNFLETINRNVSRKSE